MNVLVEAIMVGSCAGEGMPSNDAAPCITTMHDFNGGQGDESDSDGTSVYTVAGYEGSDASFYSVSGESESGEQSDDDQQNDNKSPISVSSRDALFKVSTPVSRKSPLPSSDKESNSSTPVQSPSHEARKRADEVMEKLQKVLSRGTTPVKEHLMMSPKSPRSPASDVKKTAEQAMDKLQSILSRGSSPIKFGTTQGFDRATKVADPVLNPKTTISQETMTQMIFVPEDIVGPCEEALAPTTEQVPNALADTSNVKETGTESIVEGPQDHTAVCAVIKKHSSPGMMTVDPISNTTLKTCVEEPSIQPEVKPRVDFKSAMDVVDHGTSMDRVSSVAKVTTTPMPMSPTLANIKKADEILEKLQMALFHEKKILDSMSPTKATCDTSMPKPNDTRSPLNDTDLTPTENQSLGVVKANLPIRPSSDIAFDASALASSASSATTFSGNSLLAALEDRDTSSIQTDVPLSAIDCRQSFSPCSSENSLLPALDAGASIDSTRAPPFGAAALSQNSAVAPLHGTTSPGDIISALLDRLTPVNVTSKLPLCPVPSDTASTFMENQSPSIVGADLSVRPSSDFTFNAPALANDASSAAGFSGNSLLAALEDGVTTLIQVDSPLSAIDCRHSFAPCSSENSLLPALDAGASTDSTPFSCAPLPSAPFLGNSTVNTLDDRMTSVADIVPSFPGASSSVAHTSTYSSLLPALEDGFSPSCENLNSSGQGSSSSDFFSSLLADSPMPAFEVSGNSALSGESSLSNGTVDLLSPFSSDEASLSSLRTVSPPLTPSKYLSSDAAFYAAFLAAGSLNSSMGIPFQNISGPAGNLLVSDQNPSGFEVRKTGDNVDNNGGTVDSIYEQLAASIGLMPQSASSDADAALLTSTENFSGLEETKAREEQYEAEGEVKDAVAAAPAVSPDSLFDCVTSVPQESPAQPQFDQIETVSAEADVCGSSACSIEFDKVTPQTHEGSEMIVETTNTVDERVCDEIQVNEAICDETISSAEIKNEASTIIVDDYDSTLILLETMEAIDKRARDEIPDEEDVDDASIPSAESGKENSETFMPSDHSVIIGTREILGEFVCDDSLVEESVYNDSISSSEPRKDAAGVIAESGNSDEKINADVVDTTEEQVCDENVSKAEFDKESGEKADHENDDKKIMLDEAMSVNLNVERVRHESGIPRVDSAQDIAEYCAVSTEEVKDNVTGSSASLLNASVDYVKHAPPKAPVPMSFDSFVFSFVSRSTDDSVSERVCEKKVEILDMTGELLPDETTTSSVNSTKETSKQCAEDTRAAEVLDNVCGAANENDFQVKAAEAKVERKSHRTDLFVSEAVFAENEVKKDDESPVILEDCFKVQSSTKAISCHGVVAADTIDRRVSTENKDIKADYETELMQPCRMVDQVDKASSRFVLAMKSSPPIPFPFQELGAFSITVPEALFSFILAVFMLFYSMVKRHGPGLSRWMSSVAPTLLQVLGILIVIGGLGMKEGMKTAVSNGQRVGGKAWMLMVQGWRWGAPRAWKIAVMIAKGVEKDDKEGYGTLNSLESLLFSI
ncbi:hypothetical protein HDU67_010172 [Dinochytrium kinnereticum]|nr:hypothetical protein HDU67_010172 [Dinochytrium kinnereticum]